MQKKMFEIVDNVRRRMDAGAFGSSELKMPVLILICTAQSSVFFHQPALERGV